MRSERCLLLLLDGRDRRQQGLLQDETGGGGGGGCPGTVMPRGELGALKKVDCIKGPRGDGVTVDEGCYCCCPGRGHELPDGGLDAVGVVERGMRVGWARREGDWRAEPGGASGRFLHQPVCLSVGWLSLVRALAGWPGRSGREGGRR